MRYNKVNIPCESRTCLVAYEVAEERNISACLEKVFAGLCCQRIKIVAARDRIDGLHWVAGGLVPYTS
jgi:hypothetical protein